MKDEPPLIFARKLGSLHPATPAAGEALAALKSGELIAVKFGKGGHNLKRLGFYWVMLGVAAQNLADQVDGPPLTAKRLHRILKRKLELGTWTTLPSGERFFDDDSISVAEMSEPDRAEWVDLAAKTLSGWLGVPVETLMDEARAAA